MNNKLPKSILTELNTQLKAEGMHYTPVSIRSINGYTITFSYHSGFGAKVKTFEKETETTQKPEPTTLDLLLTEGLANKTIVKSGISWYKYKGENYNGQKAIKAALVNAKQ